MRIVPRTESGLPAVVYNNDGQTRRPALALPTPFLTYHYTGVGVDYTNADVAKVIRSIHINHMANEYNYVIGQQDDGLVHEFAGLYRGAHSGGENSISIGVLFLNGVGEALTPAQIEKFLWLRRWLADRGATLATPTPHTEMPGAATPCPGPPILAVRTVLEAPLGDEIVSTEYVSEQRRLRDTRYDGFKVPLQGSMSFKAPQGAKAVHVTVTAIPKRNGLSYKPGFAALSAKRTEPAETSCVNYKSDVVANTSAATVGDDGYFWLYSLEQCHFAVDLVGWWR